jgi:hypothetical protein
LSESDFVDVQPEGEEIYYTDRRFILGKNLQNNNKLTTFSEDAIGLEGEVIIQIPKSVYRLRKKGSGSRYVHGGASLQEVIIPVLSINKKRRDTISVVDIEIIRGATSVITTGQLAITLYQTQAVTVQLQPRTLKAGIYDKEGKLISDTHEITFDFTSENPRDREVNLQFILTRKANDLNGQEVFLRLTQKMVGTSHEPEYKSLTYTIRRSFTSDFDF